jgi:competence protein ComEC
VLHKEIPFLRIGLPFCLGIVSGLYFEPGMIFLVTIIIVLISGFGLSLRFSEFRDNIIFGFCLSLALFLSGLMLYSIEKKKITTLRPEPSVFRCELSDYPEDKAKSFRLKVKLLEKSDKGTNIPIGGSLLIYVRKDSLVKSWLPGDQLTVECTPSEIKSGGNPCEFDYKSYCLSQGIRYSAFAGIENIKDHKIPGHRKLIHNSLIIREKIIDMYRARGITGDHLALVAAMTLGQKNMLDSDQKQNFIKAGVMHVMAVSGLHSVILSLFVFNLLFFLKTRFNIVRVIITILILWAFAFITGLTPSVMRATLMFSFLQAGNLMKRKVNSINSVLASAFVLAVIRPSVIFDAGFQLSYAAVIFIISFYNDLYFKIGFKAWLPDKIWQSASVTLVAQAGTLPLTIMLFNRFPTWFILTNLIIVPLSSLLIITGCLVPLTFPVRFISKFIAVILDFQTGLTGTLTEKAAALPYSSIENIGMTTLECCLLSLTIYILCIFLLRKKPFPFFYPLSLLLLYTAASSITVIARNTTGEIIVYNSPGRLCVGIRSGNILKVWSDTLVASPEAIRHASTLGLKIRTSCFSGKTICLNAGNKKIMICNSLKKSQYERFLPDYIILAGSRPDIERSFSPNRFNGYLILTGGIPKGLKVPSDKIQTSGATVYSVRKSGAFIHPI